MEMVESLSFCTFTSVTWSEVLFRIPGSHVGWPQRPDFLVCETVAVHLQQTGAMAVMFNSSSAEPQGPASVAKRKISSLCPNWSTVTKQFEQRVGLRQPWGLGTITVMISLPLEVKGGGGGWEDCKVSSRRDRGVLAERRGAQLRSRDALLGVSGWWSCAGLELSLLLPLSSLCVCSLLSLPWSLSIERDPGAVLFKNGFRGNQMSHSHFLPSVLFIPPSQPPLLTLSFF